MGKSLTVSKATVEGLVIPPVFRGCQKQRVKQPWLVAAGQNQQEQIDLQAKG
jgi:hypothetical protein